MSTIIVRKDAVVSLVLAIKGISLTDITKDMMKKISDEYEGKTFIIGKVTYEIDKYYESLIADKIKGLRLSASLIGRIIALEYIKSSIVFNKKNDTVIKLEYKNKTQQKISLIADLHSDICIKYSLSASLIPHFFLRKEIDKVIKELKEYKYNPKSYTYNDFNIAFND